MLLLQIVGWYVWQDLTRIASSPRVARLNAKDGTEVSAPDNERPQRPCTCGAISELMRALIELNRTNLKQLIISVLKKELCRTINYFLKGYAELRLVHFSMGTHSPRILSITRMPGEEVCLSVEGEYLGSTSGTVRVRMPPIEKRFGSDTEFKCEIVVEKMTANILLTLSSKPYPHLRLTLKNKPRWFFRKKILTPNNYQVRSKILNWAIDYAITTSLRLKFTYPAFIMFDRVYPFEWDMLQKQGAVYQEDTSILFTFDRLLRTFHQRKMFLVSTVEPAPWIHMDLVNMNPIAYFNLEIKRENSQYPGLLLSEEINVDGSKEICLPSVTVRSIFPESAAEDALFVEGDIILAINGVEVSSAQHAMEILDASVPGSLVRVQREVSFKWSRSNHRLVPSLDWLTTSDVNDVFPYPQSSSTKNRNFDAVLGTPDEIIANATAEGFQHMRTKEFDISQPIDQSITIPLSKENMYINFGIWVGSNIVGYGSMLLNSCLGWCQETSGQMELRLPLGNPNDMGKKPLSRHLRRYADVPGFNIRLTHGEIVLKLQAVRASGS